ncbi:MAG: histidine phosphotransferase [Alphaproteobacteria bacterium]|nr:histidine phosphotransferase [Alphaproteobacteria bacterium]
MSVHSTRIAASDLAALLGSRLCHDLVSPLGAIGNGVELLEMSPDFPGIGQSPEMRLIAEAVASARSRIQAYRMAFGLAQGDQRVSRPELARLLDGMTAQGRLTIRLEADGDFARAEIRMVMLALMCLESAMPWGGRVMVLRATPGWRLVAECDRSRLDPAIWAWLDGNGARMPAPSEVHFALLAEAAATEGRRLRHEFDDTGGEIAF